jgi:monofunctional biosynthetic peptidoglycan transglycosylase
MASLRSTFRIGGGRARLFYRALIAAGALGFGVLAYVYVTLPDVRSLARTNPTSTAFMELREAEAAAEGRTLRHRHRWVPYSRISSNLKRAVLVAEDSAFFEHEGIDVEQIRVSIETSLERGTSIRGASTITQQLAKNLYLTPSRDPLRKLRELIIARRLEAELSKARIFEIYLNVIEWGDGIWGAEAASRAYFGVSASALSREQAALLAGAIINPRVYSPARPRGRLLRRQQIILARMGGARPPVVQSSEGAPVEEPVETAVVDPATPLAEDPLEGEDPTVEDGPADEPAAGPGPPLPAPIAN